MLSTEQIESLVKEETKNVESIVHDFSHLKRTAIGARWFVKILKGPKYDQELAYIAGLLHDIVRPPTEKICHAKASSERSREILDKFDIDKRDKGEVIRAVAHHREKQDWQSPLHQSVFLADKIFEQMGAFIIFRRCMYVGECSDYAEEDALKSIIEHFQKKVVKFTPSEFPEKFRELANYQYKWVVEFANSLKNNEEWAVNLAMYGYNAGKSKNLLEGTILNFNPDTEKEKKVYKEASDYIKQKKFEEFRKLII